ncbi:MAG TPA: hypothetical protein VFZ86_14270 [Thermoleophilia bacterium]|nr:hypothetical protein [Thermoleophilia bacterium]
MIVADERGGRRAAARRRVPIGPVEFALDPAAVEGARELTRRAWRYREVERVPVIVDLGPECDESVHDVLLEDEAWFNSGVRRIERSLRLLQDDYIPVFEPPWAGYFSTPAMLGAELWWEEDPDSWPAVKSPPIRDLSALRGLEPADVASSPHFSRILTRLGIARDCLPPAVAIGGVDMMSPLGDLQGIMDQTLMFLSMKQNPDALRRACDVITSTQEAVQDATLEAVGGEGRLAGLTNWPIWRPEGAKVLVTDDVAGLLSPAVYEAFDKPYGDRLLRRYGGGLRHVCGPHPALSLYMSEDPLVHGLNCAYRFSREHLPALREEMGPRAREACGRRGHLEVMFERDMPLPGIVEAFRCLADALAPDVVAIPYCQVASDGSVSDDEIAAFGVEMRRVAEEYAARIHWDG